MKKIVIANRSEVALRVQASCHARGLKTVAIFSPEDQYSSFVYNASEAYRLSQQGYAGYLDIDQIIAIAQKAGVDAVHPGYGFLSENATFAQRVVDAGLTWVGPKPQCITLMGDKIKARECMEAVGVPVVPGFTSDDFSAAGCAAARVKAASIGYPLIIKDPRGGGGKAMRAVLRESDFDAAFTAVAAEAKKMTGSGVLLVEKYIQQGRHIEIQVAGDGKNYIHLFERECSIQRRHQKIIEEAPCNFVDGVLLEKMYTAAVLAARAVNYDSIGTVECIVTPDQQFYFLEMNTRLQVEHSVTELTTGVDLVALQLQLAGGGELPLVQSDIVRRGHAIECRLYAEDPAAGFRPSSGTLKHLVIPHHPYIRFEHDLRQGAEISPFFDPMIAKSSAVGATRETSIAHAIQFLEKCRFDGITTNRDFLKNILRSLEFVSGAFHTQSLHNKDYLARMVVTDLNDQAYASVLAGIAFVLSQTEAAAQKDKTAGHSLMHLPGDTAHDTACANISSPAAKRVWRDQRWW